MLRHGCNNHVKLQATIEEGLQVNIITQKATEKAGYKLSLEGQGWPQIVHGAAGTQYRLQGLIKLRYFPLQSPKSYDGLFYVVDDAPCDLIVGGALDIAHLSPRSDNDAWPIGLGPLSKGTHLTLLFIYVSTLYFPHPLQSRVKIPLFSFPICVAAG